MRRLRTIPILVALAVLAAAAIYRSTSSSVEASAQAVKAEPLTDKVSAQAPAGKAESAEVGIKKITAEYEKAFNAADAKAVAALWTEEGQYVGADGEVQNGRAAIEKNLTDFFKANPNAKAEVRVENIRLIGRGTATAEGVVSLKAPGEELATESHYTALHVLEDGVWRAASVQEWVHDPATHVTPKSMEWMIDDWTAKGDRGEVKITFAWDEDKVFIKGNYSITKDGKTVSTGIQMFGQNPGGGLRSWTFDSSGITNEGLWVKDGTRWVSEVTGVLPDGTEISSVNIIVPLGPNAYTWQTTDRAANGVPLPALPPVKVTRVKK